MLDDPSPCSSGSRPHIWSSVSREARLTASARRGGTQGIVRPATPPSVPRWKKLDDAIPLGRVTRLDEIASVVAFLAGDGGSYMTATTVFADGGIMRSSLGL